VVTTPPNKAPPNKDLGAGAELQDEKKKEEVAATHGKQVNISFNVIDPAVAHIFTDDRGRLIYTYQSELVLDQLKQFAIVEHRVPDNFTRMVKHHLDALQHPPSATRVDRRSLSQPEVQMPPFLPRDALDVGRRGSNHGNDERLHPRARPAMLHHVCSAIRTDEGRVAEILLPLGDGDCGPLGQAPVLCDSLRTSYLSDRSASRNHARVLLRARRANGTTEWRTCVLEEEDGGSPGSFRERPTASLLSARFQHFCRLAWWDNRRRREKKKFVRPSGVVVRVERVQTDALARASRSSATRTGPFPFFPSFAFIGKLMRGEEVQAKDFPFVSTFDWVLGLTKQTVIEPTLDVFSKADDRDTVVVAVKDEDGIKVLSRPKRETCTCPQQPGKEMIDKNQSTSVTKMEEAKEEKQPLVGWRREAESCIRRAKRREIRRRRWNQIWKVVFGGQSTKTMVQEEEEEEKQKQSEEKQKEEEAKAEEAKEEEEEKELPKERTGRRRRRREKEEKVTLPPLLRALINRELFPFPGMPPTPFLRVRRAVASDENDLDENEGGEERGPIRDKNKHVSPYSNKICLKAGKLLIRFQ
jgi:hypothetical protein